jgi:O-antigen ligase
LHGDSRHLLQLTYNTPQHPRGLRAHLVFLALALAAHGSAEPSAAIWIASLTLLFFASLGSKTSRGLTPLAIAVAVFAAWIVLSNELFNASYAAAAPFHAAFLLGGFLLARQKDAASLYRVALLGALILSVWALLQLARGERAHALFDTPATLAATLNLVLLPGLVYWVWKARGTVLGPALALLVFALAASQSRGGWLAFGAGALAAMIFARRAGLPVGKPLMLGAAALVVTGLALSLHGGTSVLARLALYGAALQSMHAPLAGSGYLSFYYYADGSTYFVHNDYLQTLLELGVPGLLALLAIVVLPLALGWRALPSLQTDQQVRVVGASAAIAATAAHALVDYPFYVPACLLLFGAALGLLDAQLPGPRTSLHRIPKSIFTALCLWLLVTPVVAEAAAAYAQRQWRRTDTESAAYWFEFARRTTPRDWRYHWYAGQFWHVGACGGNRRAGELAEAAFAAGRAANSREVRLR